MRVRYSFSCRRAGVIDEHNRHSENFPKMVRRIIGESDIILEVLDSKFIEETRNMDIEDLMAEQEKKVIYVLNKIDLADSKKIKEDIARMKLFPNAAVSCKIGKGITKLRLKIKMEAQKIKKEKVFVSIIGYPNTGKSSLVNALTGKLSARTAGESGYTKGIQKIKLFSGIFLLDTPGVIPLAEDSVTKREDLVKHAKISVRTYDRVREPEFVVLELMKEYPGLFEGFYGLYTNGNAEELIEQLGRRYNFLLKGNAVDFDRTARKILKDWQEGKIKERKKKV